MGRMNSKELINLMKGHGYKPYLVKGKDPKYMHEAMAKAIDKVYEDIKKLKQGKIKLFPMIILQSPKGWGAPKTIKGQPVEGSFKSHQVPITITNESDLKLLEKWLLSYKPNKLFDEKGKLKEEIKSILPPYEKRMSNSKYANGGLFLKELQLPKYEDYAIKNVIPGITQKEDMRQLGAFIRDIIKLNTKNANFKIFGPDEAMSNRLNHVFEVTNRKWNYNQKKNDEYLKADGMVIDSILSEHVCEGLLEGYLLTGRHGFMHSYEAFIRIIDSMVSQHAKWLKMSNELPWRKPISSLNYILTSHIQQLSL